jgi:uncharacterized membrane protein
VASFNRFSSMPAGVVAAALAGLCAFGVYACAHALGVLAGAFPVGKLPPYPAWTAIHFTASFVFVVLVPLQFWPALRRSRPRIHRVVGRIAVACACAMAAAGAPIAYLAPGRPIAERIFFAVYLSIFAFSLLRGFAAALARDIPAHRAWMTRMTAVALTALVQRIVFLPFAALIGIHSRAEFWEIFVSAAWISLAINLAVVEWWLARGRPSSEARRTLAAA